MKTLLPLFFSFLLMGAGCQKPAPEPAAPAVSAEAPAPNPAPAMAAPAAPPSAALLAPEKLTEKAPEVYKARFTTTKGEFVLEIHRDWAPNGADRFYNLVKNGYYDGAPFFRVVPGFMVQFGVNPNPAVNMKWMPARIQDDPVKQSNTPGMITFAMGGPNTRTTQVFINYGNNGNLDGMGFPPFGKVVSGMEVVQALYAGYGDAPNFGGNGPDQGRAQTEGAAYLDKDFPKFDKIKQARIE